jgi:hypothetical protein
MGPIFPFVEIYYEDNVYDEDNDLGINGKVWDKISGSGGTVQRYNAGTLKVA